MKQFTILLSFLAIISCSETEKQSIDTSETTHKELDEQNAISLSIDKVIEYDTIKEFLTEEPVEKTIEEEFANQKMKTETDEKVSDEKEIKRFEEQLVNEKTAGSAKGITASNTPPQPTNVPLKPNHDQWDVLLRKNVSSSGKVNYSGMKASITDLEAYVLYLESFNTRDAWSRNEKLAYWINLYNAATVRLICHNYPVTSITNLSGGKPWDQNVVKIGAKQYSLNDIENTIIRPRFKEARIHFAVNCAAKSCPPIMNSAFMAEKLSRQLQKQTTKFINSSENNITAAKVEISKIFDWYKDDFEKGNLIQFLNKYSTIPINDDATIVFKEYDWNLNK